ncbi:MAG: tetratricopeptide repeat protein [Candidatus Krumholzibacteriota bacterium]
MAHPGTDPNSQPARYPVRTTVILALAALALRAGVIIWRQGHDPLFHQPINDAAIYDQWARALLASRGFGLEDAPFFLPPLYPYLTALLYRIGGGGIWMVTIFQALCGVGTVLGIHRLGFRLHGPRAGLLASVLALLCAPVLWYEGWQLPTALNLFLLTVVLNLLIEIPALKQPTGRRSLAVFLALGLALGLAAVGRPQNLLLAVFVLLWLWWRGKSTGAAVYRSLGIILAALLVPIAPVTIHNLKASGEPVLISANGGVNFYVGNHKGADGRFSFPPGFPSYIGQMQAASRRMAQAEAGQDLDWRQTSAHWFKKGWGDLTEDPGRALGLGLHKARLLVSWREMENNFVVGWVHERSGPGRLLIPSLGLFWLLALPALIEAVRRREPKDLAMIIPTVTVILVCLIFWVSTRNRLPLLIPLAVLAGASLSNPRLWKSPVNLGVVALVAVAVFWPTSDHEGAGFLCDVGRIHAQQGQITQARENFNEALRQEPDHPMAMNGLALTYMDAGQPERAIALLRQVVRKHPDFELAKRNLQAILNHQKKNR